MDWSEVGGVVAKAAPLLGTLLLGPGVGTAAGAGVGALIAKALGTEPTPEAVMTAINTDPEWAAKLKIVEDTNRTKLEAKVLDMESQNLSDVNETMQVEVQSEDKFVKRARPFLIWSVGVSVIMEVIVAALVVFVAPEQINSMGNLFMAISIPQGVAAAMCGVYMKQRTVDKALEAGHAPPQALIPALLAKFVSK